MIAAQPCTAGANSYAFYTTICRVPTRLWDSDVVNGHDSKSSDSARTTYGEPVRVMIIALYFKNPLSLNLSTVYKSGILL